MQTIGIHKEYGNPKDRFGKPVNYPLSAIVGREIYNHEAYYLLLGPIGDLIDVLDEILRKKYASKKAYRSVYDRRIRAASRIGQLESSFNKFGRSIWN